MALPNYYEILNVPFDADPETIRQTYRNAARRSHPDAGGNWTFEFTLITEAYKTLRDTTKRQIYDEALKATYPFFVASRPKAPATGRHKYQLARFEDPLAGQNTDSGRWAVIGAGTVIQGHLSGRRDLLIKGEVHGTVRIPANHLIVAETGKVGVFTQAKEIEVWGSIIGELRALGRVILRRGARVTGEIFTPSLAVEDGAYCTAKVEMQRD